MHFERQEKKPHPTVSLHPTIHRQHEHQYIYCMITSSSPEISPAALDNGQSPPMSPPCWTGSVVPLTPKSPQGVGSKLLCLPQQRKTTSEHCSYTVNRIKRPHAQTRDAYGALQARHLQKISPFRRVSRNDQILELLTAEKLLGKPTQVTVTNKPGAESMKQKKQPCRNVTCLAKQCPDAEHLAAWQGVCAFISGLRGRQRRLWDL